MRRRVHWRPAPALRTAACTMLLLAACTPAQRLSQPPTSAVPSPSIQSPLVQTSAPAEPTRKVREEPVFSCFPPAEPSPSMTEGPYFIAGSPERGSLLEASTSGERLVVSGHVLSNVCEPIPGAKLDFWQADGNGVYDNSGYSLRGHQFTDSSGRYELTTVVPGLYPGRTAHIHVKVEAPGRQALTTQLFFPGSANQADRIFDERLLIDVQRGTAGWIGRFEFVLAGE